MRMRIVGRRLRGGARPDGASRPRRLAPPRPAGRRHGRIRPDSPSCTHAHVRGDRLRVRLLRRGRDQERHPLGRPNRLGPLEAGRPAPVDRQRGEREPGQLGAGPGGRVHRLHRASGRLQRPQLVRRRRGRFDRAARRRSAYDQKIPAGDPDNFTPGAANDTAWDNAVHYEDACPAIGNVPTAWKLSVVVKAQYPFLTPGILGVAKNLNFTEQSRDRPRADLYR